ncbi:MAG: Flp family type IVb pilin [Sphingomonas sp.]
MAVVRAIGKAGRDTRGAVAVEYGFLAALIVIAILFALMSLGSANLDVWTNVTDKIVNAQ